MTTTDLTERTIIVAGKPIFVAETGAGPAVVMLHGGGPGASGVSNYSRNIACSHNTSGSSCPTCLATAAP
jgi:4,5:9,10-diseco-3-hydroxy-5,9,17-trioxoandrosta-1(10),2-diene-4-oate hydrolase